MTATTTTTTTTKSPTHCGEEPKSFHPAWQPIVLTLQQLLWYNQKPHEEGTLEIESSRQQLVPMEQVTKEGLSADYYNALVCPLMQYRDFEEGIEGASAWIKQHSVQRYTERFPPAQYSSLGKIAGNYLAARRPMPTSSPWERTWCGIGQAPRRFQ